jgi:hypothetical protein
MWSDKTIKNLRTDGLHAKDLNQESLTTNLKHYCYTNLLRKLKKDVKASSNGLILGTIPKFGWKAEEKHYDSKSPG